MGSSTTMEDTEQSDEFDPDRVLMLIRKTKSETEELFLDFYCDAYEELCKFFKAVGTVFGFVSSDVSEKVDILRDYMEGSSHRNFLTVQKMVQYEMDNGLTNRKRSASGCRTFLRLHRALLFIIEFLDRIRSTDGSSKMHKELLEAYDVTLAPYHSWLVRKAVHVAMYTTPSRERLLLKLRLDDTVGSMLKVGQLRDDLKRVYDISQEVLVKHNLLDLQ